jgi:hypothetical protein
MNTTEVATAVEKKAVVRDNIIEDKGKRDIAAAAVENLAAAGGMGFAGVEGRCGSLAPAICVM